MQSHKSLFDDDDIMGLIDQKSNKSRKSSLLDELYGQKSRDSSLSAKKVTSDAKSDILSTLSKPNVDASGYSFLSSEPRPRRRPVNVSVDPLGLLTEPSFQSEVSKHPEKPISPEKSPDDNLPEWLGGPKVQKKEVDKPSSKPLVETENTKAVKPTIHQDTLASKSVLSQSNLDCESKEEENQDNRLVSKLLEAELDQQSTIMCLQQQEHELKTAVSLSRQSDKLNVLLETQKIKLGEQEKQFNLLISKQLERQAQLEAQMKSQQQRIDSYIQALTTQQTLSTPILVAAHKEDDYQESGINKAELECQVQKLQLEKMYLENTIDSIKDKHEREINILDEFYRKQITLLEESMVQMEKRMQDDIESLEGDYKNKIKKLKEEITENERLHKVEKLALKEEQIKTLEEIRKRHLEDLELLQLEHKGLLENITKSKESEQKAMEIMTNQGSNVENVLNKSQVLIEGLECLQKKFVETDKHFEETCKNQLDSREKQIEYLRESLEKEKRENDEQKQNFMLKVEKLEHNICKLTDEFLRQNSILQEKELNFKAREQALMKDREIFIEQSKYEREKFQAMTETWKTEQERQLEYIAQDRQALASERGKLHIFNRLKFGFENSTKTELEATIKAAQDTISSANQERMKWQEKLHELELQQATLNDKERHLVLKAKELQDLTKAALIKREEGIEALREAQYIEERYKQKFDQLGIQEEILTQRESQLASEKLDLVSERLSLRIGEDKPERDLNTMVKSEQHSWSMVKNIQPLPHYRVIDF